MVNLVSPRRYPNPGDISMRLSNSVVRFKEKPILVRNVVDNNSISAIDLLSSKTLPYSIHSSDEDLDISSPPLGYYNDTRDSACMYLTRAPEQRQKQGVEFRAIYNFDVFGNYRRGNWNFNYPDFGKMIIRDYPKFEEAVRIAFNQSRDPGYKYKGWAFDRFYYVARLKDSKKLKLRHILETVGYYDTKSDKLFLFNRICNPRMISQLEELTNGIEIEVLE